MNQAKDYIKITGLKIYAHHGVLKEEQEQGQDFYINAKLFYDMKRPGSSDALDDAVNYADVCGFMERVFTQTRFNLIEAAAEHLCKSILREYSLLTAIELEMCKPSAPIPMVFENVSVHLYRAWHRVYLSVGSNMGDRKAYIESAVSVLAQHPDMRDVRLSSLIETKPYGPVEQEDFLNGCIELMTLSDPEELLDVLHEIEQQADRRREIHWGPRTLDLDILFYDKLVYESKRLIIPHADMENRSFVLEPLAELAPNLRHPLLGLTVEQMRTQCKSGEKTEAVSG